MLFKLIYYPCIIEYRKLTETVETELRKLENIEEKRVEAEAETETENAFRLIDISGNHFTIAVHDNIDRMEETLSGKF